MSLNGPREKELTFVDKQMGQVEIQEFSPLRPNEIKNTSINLRAFAFYRNYHFSKQKKITGKRKIILIG